MICKVCGYEASENFSVCPYCGEGKKEYSPAHQINEQNIKPLFKYNSSSFSIENYQDTFVINLKDGGEFFPNKEIGKIAITYAFSYSMIWVLLMCLPDNSQMYWIFIYIISVSVIFLIWYLLTNVKAKCIFDKEGINISSKKGTLFISKQNVKNISVKIRKETYRTKHGNEIVEYFYYILLEFKEKIYIPYARESKTAVVVLDNFQCEEGKKIAHCTVNEIKKVLKL